MSDEPTISLSELETVPQNVWGVNPVDRERPYLGNVDSQRAYMRFLGYERGILTARVMELNSRAEQIAYIYECKRTKAYLATADRITTTSRSDESYFYEWLDELAAQGIAYASKRKSVRPTSQIAKPTYRWDSIEQVVNVCLNKGLTLEVAAKVASVGIQAVERYLRYGIISLDNDIEGRVLNRDTVIPEDGVRNDRNETQADVLKELATANSSRGATMLANDRIGADYARVGTILEDKTDIHVDGMDSYFLEVQQVQHWTGEYTPYKSYILFEKNTPIQLRKFILMKISESLSRIL